jgi:hypothetical protein
MKARKWLPVLIMLGLAAAYGGPLLITYVANAEQDECTFGPVSNFQYRDYLSRAKDLSSKMPGGFSWNQEEAKIRFNELFENLIDRKPSAYERIAAAHALLRSFGAQYRNMSGTDPDPYGSVAKTGGVVGFNYQPAWPVPSFFAFQATSMDHSKSRWAGTWARTADPWRYPFRCELSSL